MLNLIKNKEAKGHLLAFITILIWSLTLVSVKILLEELKPMEIVFYRFFIAYFLLLVLHPKIKKPESLKEELVFFGCGLTGICIYMFTQNLALLYTNASNVGLILAAAPMFTAGLFGIFYKEKIGLNYFIGFLVAFVGIFLVIFNGKLEIDLSFKGDMLAIITALSWAVYSLILRKALKYNLNVIYSTRKIFFYAVLTLAPIMFFGGYKIDFTIFKNQTILYNILFLSFGASGVAFVTWSMASEMIGGLKTTAYIYLSPLLTVIFSFFLLGEKISFVTILGFVFIILGLYISDKKSKLNT